MEGWRRRIGRLTASFEQAAPASREAARLLAAQNAQDVRPRAARRRLVYLLFVVVPNASKHPPCEGLHSSGCLRRALERAHATRLQGQRDLPASLGPHAVPPSSRMCARRQAQSWHRQSGPDGAKPADAAAEAAARGAALAGAVTTVAAAAGGVAAAAAAGAAAAESGLPAAPGAELGPDAQRAAADAVFAALWRAQQAASAAADASGAALAQSQRALGRPPGAPCAGLSPGAPRRR
jgi:hypothetical protein